MGCRTWQGGEDRWDARLLQDMHLAGIIPRIALSRPFPGGVRRLAVTVEIVSGLCSSGKLCQDLQVRSAMRGWGAVLSSRGRGEMNDLASR